MIKFLYIFIILIYSCYSYSSDTSRIVVEFKEIPTKNTLLNLRKKYGIEEINLFYKYKSNYYERVYTVENYSGDFSLLKADLLFKNVERVYPVDENSIIPREGRTLTNDSFINYQWGLFNSQISLLQDLDDINSRLIIGTPGNDIQISSIINNDYTGEKIIVAVLDSGVDLDHPDLKDSIYKNIKECDSNGHFRYRPKDDIDNNGHVGDCMGWDFTAKKGTHITYDDKGHGTHVSGIIAASANNIGVRGVAPFVKILPVKIIKKRENTSGHSSFTDRVAKGILYSIKMKAQVINLSLGWPKILDTNYVREAVKEANRNGVTIVAAAGNNSSNQAIYPCAYPEVICVGATTINGDLARFSNYGGHVDLLAPGEQILSTYPTKLVPSYFSVNGYEIKNGTSQAAPFVSGAVGILKNKFPNLSEQNLKMKLLKSTLPLLNQESSIAGLLQVKKSLEVTDDLFVIPDFKQLSDVKVKSINNQFEFSLTLNNLSKESGIVNYSISSKSKHISFISGYTGITQINDKVKIKVIGIASNLDRSSNINLRVDLKFKDKSINFTHNLRLILDIDDNTDNIFPVNSTHINNGVLAKVINGKIYPKIKTVIDKFRAYNKPEYYFTNFNVDRTSLLINIIKVNNNDTQIISTSINNITKVISCIKIDLNYDGIPDYLVRSIGKSSGEKYLIYSYLDSNLRPLFSQQSFRFYPETVILNTKSFGFIPMMTKEGLVATPMFISRGMIPKVSLNPDPWSEEDLSIKSHVYVLYPDFEESLIKTKIFDDYKNLDAIKTKISSKWFDSINFVELFHQSKLEFENGSIKIAMAAGNNNYILNIRKDLSYTIESLELNGFTFAGHFFSPVTKLGENSEFFNTTALVGLQSDTLAQVGILDLKVKNKLGAHFSYSHKPKYDSLLGVMGSFIDKSSVYSFFQSKNKIIYNRFYNNKLYTYSYPVNRVSFIPGNIFNELFYPTIKGRGYDARPAFYVDSTQLNSNHVFVISAEDSKLTSSIRNNISIPNNCSALNPTRFNDYENFTLFCYQKEQANKFNFYLMYLPIK